MARRKWNLDVIQQVVNNEQPFVQFGYTGIKVRHKNGDVWTDTKGIKWKMENGVVKRINEQADSIRELVKRKCSNCGFDVGMLGNKLDEKLFSKTGMCLDCTQARELEMIIEGKIGDYVQQKLFKNKLSLAKEFRKNVIETIKYLKKDDSKIEMIHSNGSITTWTGSQNEKLLKEAEEDLKKVNQLINEMEEELKKVS